MTKSTANSPERQKKILSEYHHIAANAKDIGKRNQLLSAYALGIWFIAMNRMGSLSPEQNCQIMLDGLQKSKLFRLVMGDADHYLAPKRIEKQKQWAKTTHLRRYENDWVVDVLPGNGTYDLGYDYLECGICKLCRDEGCPELAKYLCKMDYLFAEIMGLRLERTTTLAEGGEKCDFRFSRKISFDLLNQSSSLNTGALYKQKFALSSIPKNKYKNTQMEKMLHLGIFLKLF